MANRPRAEILVDRGPLVVLDYKPDMPYQDKNGNTKMCDSARVYVAMGTDEDNARSKEHSFIITAYTDKERKLMRRYCEHMLKQDDREVAKQDKVPNIACLLEAKVVVDNRPYVKDKEGNEKPNDFFGKNTVRYQMRNINRNNPVDGNVTVKRTIKQVKSKTGEDLNISKPMAYIKGATIFPENKQGAKNGKPYTQKNGATGRKLDIAVGNQNLSMFVPDETIAKNKVYQDIFSFIDSAESKQPWVINFTAPLDFGYRKALDPDTKQEIADSPKNVLKADLGVAEYIHVVEKIAPAAEHKVDNESIASETPDEQLDNNQWSSPDLNCF